MPGPGPSTDRTTGTSVIAPWAPLLSKPRSLKWERRCGWLTSQDTGLKLTNTLRPGGPIRSFVFTFKRRKNDSAPSSMLSKPPCGENLGPGVHKTLDGWRRQIWPPLHAYLRAQTRAPGLAPASARAQPLCVQIVPPWRSLSSQQDLPS